MIGDAYEELSHLFNSSIKLIEIVSRQDDRADPNFQPFRQRPLRDCQCQYIPSMFKNYMFNLHTTDWSNAISSCSTSPHDVQDACMSNAIISAFKSSFESYKPHKAKGVKLDHAFLAKLCKDLENYKEKDPLPMSVDEAIRFSTSTDWV